MKKMKMLGPALVLIGIVSLMYFSQAIVNTLIIHNTGQVSMVKAFWDNGATQEISAIDWPNLLPDSTQNKTIWLKNLGAASVNVTLGITDWVPLSASNYFHISWDRDNQTITPGFTLSCTVTLNVFANITLTSISSFSYNMTVYEGW
jgi:hypothetical protein